MKCECCGLGLGEQGILRNNDSGIGGPLFFSYTVERIGMHIMHVPMESVADTDEKEVARFVPVKAVLCEACDSNLWSSDYEECEHISPMAFHRWEREQREAQAKTRPQIELQRLPENFSVF